MKYSVVLREGEDGWIIAECPAIPGCVTQGKTEEEALANIQDAMIGCLEILNGKRRAAQCPAAGL